jgi:hypothetical protein
MDGEKESKKGNLAQLVKPVGLYTYNPSTWEAEAEESQI